MLQAAPWKREITGRGDWAGDRMSQGGTGHRAVANKSEQGPMGDRKYLGPVRVGNQLPWSGEPWANHGEPDHWR